MRPKTTSHLLQHSSNCKPGSYGYLQANEIGGTIATAKSGVSNTGAP